MKPPENLVDSIIPEVLYRVLFGRRNRMRALVNSMLQKAWLEGYAQSVKDELNAMQSASKTDLQATLDAANVDNLMRKVQSYPLTIFEQFLP